MADAGFPEHEIQRRGRWASACWKIYCWGTRALGSGVANRMAKAPSDIFAHLRSRCLQNLRWFDVLSGPLPLAFLGSVGPPRPGGWAEISPSVVKSRALCQKTSEWAGAAVVASRRQPAKTMAKTLVRAARKCGGMPRGRHRSRSRETAEELLL